MRWWTGGRGVPVRRGAVRVAGCSITESLFVAAFSLGARRMDEAAGDLKQALPSACDTLQIHVEVHQKSNRSLSAFRLCGTLL